ncbi:MAG: cytochrome c3 family protein [Acidobacteriota bacterium]
MTPGGGPGRLRALLRSGSLRMMGLSVGLAAGLALVAAGTAMEVSSRPAFCGSCHVMTPYYESWRASTHRNVACVECHIPPGITAELRKKYEALAMVARYFTGTYGTNPWAEIDDAACLRCHERRLLRGRELFGDVLFDHSAHLAGMRRGKTLRCTSCHSQIVQGSHITVTASTCILCHFKGRESGTGTARCTLCHDVPDAEIRRGTPTFSHADVARYGMDCTWCHARPEGSDGDVPRERCLTCHNEPAHLAEYGRAALLHRTHVSEHKVDCMNCHLEIRHVGEPRIERAVSACGSCHRAGHSPQLMLYSGIGGRGLQPMPSPMFLAGVRCEGCHIALPGRESEVHRADEVSCMSCHGPGYLPIYETWKRGVAARAGALRRQMERTRRRLDGAAPARLADALFNLELVTRGRGVHNVDYSFALLEKARADMNAARESAGLSALPRPWPEAAVESPCLRCHQGIESGRGRFLDRAFRHDVHLARARLECAACHRPHEERPPGEVVRFGAGGCASCHHRDPAAACAPCHAGVRRGTVPSPLGPFDHAFHLDEMELDCGGCHLPGPGGRPRLDREICASCHG